MSLNLFIYSLEDLNKNFCYNKICWTHMDGWIQERVVSLKIAFTSLLLTSSAKAEWEQTSFHIHLLHILQ